MTYTASIYNKERRDYNKEYRNMDADHINRRTRVNQTTNSRINAIQEKYIQAFTEELQRLRKEAHPSQGNSSGQPYRGDTFNQVCDYYNKKIKNEYINKDELQRILDEQFVLINTKVVEALNAAGNARM